MKIRQRQKIAPVTLGPNDSIRLLVDGEVVVEDTVDRSIQVDEAMTFDLEKRELDKLGLEDGIGGLFGQSKRD